MREGRDTTPTGGLSVLFRGGIDTVLVPYAKALAGQGDTFVPDLFARRSNLKAGKSGEPIDDARD
jgi:hypothetical protein